jgi:hypothetical protein
MAGNIFFVMDVFNVLNCTNEGDAVSTGAMPVRYFKRVHSSHSRRFYNLGNIICGRRRRYLILDF